MSDTTANEHYQPASNDSVFCATQPLNEEKIRYLNIHKTSALDAICLLHCFNTTRARLRCSLRRMEHVLLPWIWFLQLALPSF